MSESSFILTCLLLIVASFSGATPPAASKTSELFVLAGGPGEERLKSTILTDNGDSYLVYGSFSLVARQTLAQPQEVVIWGRNALDLSFFELTPLLGVFESAQSATDLRKALLENPGNSENQLGGKDRQRLEALVNSTTPAAGTLRWQREVALQAMKDFELTNFEELFARYQRQKDFAQTATIAARPSELGRLFEVPGNAGAAPTGWAHLIKFLDDRKLCLPILRTKVSSSTQPRFFGYVRRIAKDGVTKVGGEILVAAKGLEPDRIPVALEIEYQPPLFGRLLEALPTTLVTTLIGLIGTLGGAVIGYKFFLYQQENLRHWETQKQFSIKKIELSKKILKFFSQRYANMLENEDAEISRVADIRKTLIDEDIYAILMADQIQMMNNICDPTYQMAGSRTEALDKLLKNNFGEFMV